MTGLSLGQKKSLNWICTLPRKATISRVMTKSKIAIITGAGSGIGQATAIEFSKNGYQCILVGRTLEKLQQTASLISQLQASKESQISRNLASRNPIPNKPQTLVFDFQNLQDIYGFFHDNLSSQKADIEVLVNNAGVYSPSSLESSELDLWQRMMAINFLAPVELTKAVYPWMKANQTGSIVNVSSTLGLRPIPQAAAYAASKAAMNSWTSSLAMEAGPFGVRVNGVCPGLVDTPIHSFFHLPPAERKVQTDSLKSRQPLQRIGTPEEIARAIYFLASADSAWTTGALLNVDGGINL